MPGVAARGSRAARRGGFFSAHALFWILLGSLAAGIVVERVTHLVSSWRDTSPDIVQRARAEIGLEAAEDWLCESFERGDAVRALNVHAANALKRIEAVRMDGGAFDAETALAGLGVEVFIADVSFDAALFPSGTPPYAIPVIPHERSGDWGRYRYFIRSSAGTDERNYRTVCEELLEIEFDAAFHTLADARRVFFRRASEPR